MTAVMRVMHLTMLLSLWTMWPTMAQELPNKKSSNHVGNSNNDPVAHQEANIEAKVTNLRNKNISTDASSIEEAASGQELDSTTWFRVLFPLHHSTRGKPPRTPMSRKKPKKNMKKGGFNVNNKKGKPTHSRPTRGRPTRGRPTRHKPTHHKPTRHMTRGKVTGTGFIGGYQMTGKNKKMNSQIDMSPVASPVAAAPVAASPSAASPLASPIVV